MSLPTPNRAQQRGFSLIEVLVAVLVVAVGVLGIVGLQLVTMRANTSAMMRTQANQLAYDVIDRARANPNVSYAIAMGDDPPADPDCEANDCTPAQMMAYDQAQWLSAARVAGLPLGDGSIVLNGNIIQVTVQWDDDGDGVVDATPLVVRTQLQ